METYLLSIKKEPFEALLDGRKKHEFRRRFSKISSDFQVVFYVSDPVKAICGVGIFEKPIYDKKERMIELVKTHQYSSQKSIDEYFNELEMGYALPLKNIKKIEPISLDKIRKYIPGFMPPQSYCKFKKTKFSNIMEMIDLYDASNETEQRTLF